MSRTLKFLLVFSIAVLMPHAESFAQLVPGDVFREYTWYNKDGDAGEALRVGGRIGYQGHITLDHDFDLEHAVKAEMVVEKILCHDGTKDLAIQINDNDWLQIPEAQTIPYPQWEYQHHTYPIVPVPLSFLESGTGNRFQMRVNPTHSWKWPQNLINGVHFRIYYDPEKKAHPTGKITSIESGGTIGLRTRLQVEAESPNGKIKRVDYVGHYYDVNFEGDGIYRQWHYHFFHGKITHYVGSAYASPYQITWDTSWVPDQKEPMQITARIIDETGMIYMTDAINNLRLVRPGMSVELCEPYNIPRQWVTRKGRKQENFDVAGDLSKAIAAQLVWVSWCPGYMEGIFINDKKVFDNEGPHYQYYAHRITLNDLVAFRTGQNTLATGGNTKRGIHGMEVNWPGIMVLIKYKDE